MMKRGFLLISSVFLALFLGIILSFTLVRAYIQMREIETRRASIYAFYAAEAGIERAIFELRKNMQWRAGFNNEPVVWEGTANHTLGYYDVKVVNATPLGSLPTVWIRSEGRDASYTTTQGTPLRKVILARVAVQTPTAFFTLTVGDLRIVSGANVGGDILARDVIFEVFEDMPSPQININGTVFYIRDIQGENDPNVSIKDKQKVSPITFVSVDLERYRRLAQLGGKYVDGDFVYSGLINRNNLETVNGLIFAEGDVYIQGNVEESVHIVAGGDIYITGNITCQDSAQIGLSTKNNVIISASAPYNLTIDAFIYMEGDVFKAEGEKYSKGTLDFEGAIAIKGGKETAIDLSSYSLRHYLYDTELRDNLSIPFMSYIADIVSWQEVPPDTPFPPPS